MVNNLGSGSKLDRAESLGWLIAIISADMEKLLDAQLKEIGLSINLWPTLFALWEKDGLTQSELAAKCNTAHYTTTRVLNHLEKMELVKRKHHPASKRTRIVHLTKKAQNIRQQALSKARKCNAEVLSELTILEAEVLHSILVKIVTNSHPEIKPIKRVKSSNA